MIDQALQEKRSVKIVTAEGHTITNIKAHFKERVDFTADKQNLDDMIQTAYTEGEKVISANKRGYKNIQPVVFITDDNILRDTAHSAKMAAASTKDWLNVLSRFKTTRFLDHR